MPSEKRSRQRELRRAKDAERQRRHRKRRHLRQVSIAVVVAAAVVGVIFLVSSGSPHKKAASPKTTTTTTTTTSKAVTPVCPPTGAKGASHQEIDFKTQPPICIPAHSRYRLTFHTDVGTFIVDTSASAETRAVNNFVFLARYHFFDKSPFQRVIPGFVVQGGAPAANSSGGPGYEWTGNAPASSCSAKNDCYAPYDVAYANSGKPTSNGSQFFIVLPGGEDQLGRLYTLLGQVVGGRSVVNAIAKDGSSSGTPKHEHHMVSVTVSEIAS